MSGSASTWREEEIRAMARKIAEEVFDEKMKALKKRFDELGRKIDDLYYLATDGD